MNWEQLKAILGLRLRLSRNQWARSKFGIGNAFALLTAVGSVILTALTFVGGFWTGASLLGHARSNSIMQVWIAVIAAFLFFWLMGLLVELQRAESIDLQRLMHLPVRLGQVFALNYIASHFVLSLIIFAPFIIGLTLGLARSRGAVMLLQLPLAFSVILLITSWTYWLKGWLASLISNPRRKRSVIAIVTLIFVLFAQLPNIYFNVFNRPSQQRHHVVLISELLHLQKYFPPFWASLGAGALAEHHVLPALLGTAGCLALAGFGLLRAYRATLGFYQGRDDKSKGSPARARDEPARPSTPSKYLDLRLPGLSDEASAVALFSLRSMLRAPEIKMAWGMSILVTIILGLTFFYRSHTQVPASFKSFLIPSLLSFSMLTLAQFLTNQFGYDREGFQSYVMSPLDRRAILLGKNVAALPVICFAGFLWIALALFLVKLPLLAAAAAVFQVATAAFIAMTFGNWVSIYVPYRIRVGSLKPTKVTGARGFLLALCALVLPLTLLPIFVAPAAELFLRFTNTLVDFPVNLVLSSLFTILAALSYWWLLNSLRYTLQRRETKILEVITSDVE